MKNNKKNNNSLVEKGQFEKVKKENEKLKLENQTLKTEIGKLQNQLNALEDFKKLYEQESKKNLMIKYKKPTLVGLNNIGATCFMNATLQCLSQTEKLTKYFLNENNIGEIINNNIALKNKNQNQLSPVYLELLQNLWSKDGQKAFSLIIS